MDVHPRAQDTHRQPSPHYATVSSIPGSTSFPDANATHSPMLPAMARPALPTILENTDTSAVPATGAPADDTVNAAVSQPFSTAADTNADAGQSTLQQEQQQQYLTPTLPEDDIGSVNPAMLLGRFDKRKSSPAVLGLPYGLGGGGGGSSSSGIGSSSIQAQLGLQQHRNSIEAAMLLANFNRIPLVGRSSPDDKGSNTTAGGAWQDDASVTQPKDAWMSDDGSQLVADTEAAMLRRHSYDVGMDWKDLPEARSLFSGGRIDFLSDIASVDGTSGADVSSSADDQAETASKLTWTHDGTMLNNDTSTGEYAQLLEFIQHPVSARPSPHASPRTMYSSSSGGGGGYPYIKYAPYPAMAQQPPPPPPASFPPPTSFQPSSVGPKREYQGDAYMQQHGYRSAMPPPPFPPQHQPPIHPYYYQQQQQQQQQQMAPVHPMSPAGPIQAAPKPARRKRARADDEEGEVVEPGDKDFPAMSPRDVEAARTDPEARPRRQKLRFEGDQYTPQWVRYNGQAKEGLCDTCSPGKWLQLKNSAFWYHKQFFHGISSVSGQPFIKPLETRWVDQDLVEGLCHQCRQWVPVSNVKRKNSVLWYRHAHKCHVYHKPKVNGPKKR